MLLIIIACKWFWFLSSREILTEHVVAHPITIFPFPRFSLWQAEVNLLMPSWSPSLLWKGVMCAHMEVDLRVKRCNTMHPRVVNVCKQSTLVHITHIVQKSLCMAMWANDLISQFSFWLKLVIFWDVNPSTPYVWSVTLYLYFLLHYLNFLPWCTRASGP